MTNPNLSDIMSDMSFPTTTIPTTLGDIVVTATDYNHVAIRSTDEADLVINGVRYRFHGHLNRYEDTARPFQPHRTYYEPDIINPETGERRFREYGWATLRRVGNYETGTEAAYRKLRSIMVDTVNTFLDTEAGKTMLNEAEVYDENRRLDAAQRAYDEAVETAERLLLELNEVRASIGLDPEEG